MLTKIVKLTEWNAVFYVLFLCECLMLNGSEVGNHQYKPNFNKIRTISHSAVNTGAKTKRLRQCYQISPEMAKKAKEVIYLDFK